MAGILFERNGKLVRQTLNRDGDGQRVKERSKESGD